ncbi:hypothetical protein LINGRAPRIM_LOCUS2814 [Linum grandiflorum]
MGCSKQPSVRGKCEAKRPSSWLRGCNLTSPASNPLLGI